MGRSPGSTKRKTDASCVKPSLLTITEPSHIGCGQKVRLLCILNRPRLNLIVRLKDGSLAALDQIWTDLVPPEAEESVAPELDINCLLELSKFIKTLKQ